MPMTAGTPTAAPHVVTPDSVAAVAPAWSIDGTRIAFIGAFATGNDVGIVSDDGAGGVQQPTRGAGAIRVRWSRAERLDLLLVSGSWGADTLSLRTITTEGGVTARHPEVSFGSTSAEGFFDVSRLGSKLVWTRRQALGDLWLLQAESGSY
jgi:hypothetical protein